ncbi:uncharacterized protein LOC131158782 isoform X3 [Malania oleifera]|uniref:uncharacterized protein LOC131158782 isoform X3 n=1 Tax=Malania oleifera TaxID=397392 RepID=UPI0025AEA11E|nr:uncharacterized protein LOC131158782 isoform X3 [Malania oleifera]
MLTLPHLSLSSSVPSPFPPAPASSPSPSLLLRCASTVHSQIVPPISACGPSDALLPVPALRRQNATPALQQVLSQISVNLKTICGSSLRFCSGFLCSSGLLHGMGGIMVDRIRDHDLEDNREF